MFILDENATYPWPVKWRAPSETRPGEHDEHEIEVTYRRLSTDEHTELRRQLTEEGLKDPDFAVRVVAGFSKVQLRDGTAMAFSEASLRKLMAVPHLAPAIVLGYYESRQPAAEKN